MSKTAFAIVVTDGQSGLPVKDATVLISQAEVGQEARTNNDGYTIVVGSDGPFVVDVDVPLGFTIHHQEYISAPLEVITPSLNLQIYRPVTPHLTRLRASGIGIVDGYSRPWTMRGLTQFLLWKNFLDDKDITPTLREMRALGAGLPVWARPNELRVFGMCHNIAQFYPHEYAGYWTRLPDFGRLLAQYEFYFTFCVFADAQIVMSNRTAQQAHYNSGVATLQSIPNSILELVNEFPQNGIDPSRFTDPSGLLASQGSGLGDRGPAWPGWTLHDQHERRDWQKVIGGAVDGWDISHGIPYFEQGYGERVFRVAPIVFGEGIGFAERDEPNRRSSSPVLAGLKAREYRLLGSGGRFHSGAGVFSQPFGPVTTECARAFFGGFA